MSNSEKVNIWEKVNISAVVASVIVAATGVFVGIYMDKIKCFFKPQESNCSELCMKHTRISGTEGDVGDTGWICSKEDRESELMYLGDDDIYWQNQELSFKTEGVDKFSNAKICGFYSGVNDRGAKIERNDCSESSNNYEGKISLGNDIDCCGRNQNLAVTISSQKKNYEICLLNRRKNSSSGKIFNSGWQCNSENPVNYIDLGDHGKWKDQYLRFEIRKKN
ncbi:MAG: hypothetical protein F6K22_32140 [Okeania sp. SIO2F4]|uniref:hypothetical protein n=1 Tax=Okeania sp. SIO2F4 TaxID=2607790 RepID=UPI00142C2184|nr:hypothetical protein [Okeania sp. SIO2F4]NES07044.1 hypothetical protein [Okeania sp. SIO2F4]